MDQERNLFPSGKRIQLNCSNTFLSRSCSRALYFRIARMAEVLVMQYQWAVMVYNQRSMNAKRA